MNGVGIKSLRPTAVSLTSENPALRGFTDSCFVAIVSDVPYFRVKMQIALINVSNVFASLSVLLYPVCFTSTT